MNASDILFFLIFYIVLLLPGLLIARWTIKSNETRIAIPIFLLSATTAPFFDFLAPAIGVPFLGGGCGGMLISPVIGLIISPITGFIGWVVGRIVVKKTENTITKNKWIILIGASCGFVAGILAALIFYPDAC
jgi:hypothetical protein